MFRPKNAPPTNAEKFESIELAKVGEMSPEELSSHRLNILDVQSHLKSKLAETATQKQGSYDEEAIRAYISQILINGFNLQATTLCEEADFRDAQKLKYFKALIREVVESGPFGEKQFKIHELRLQRSAIAQSKTLHELRQNVRLMIGPLTLYRELKEFKEIAEQGDKAGMAELSALIEEIEEKDSVVAEQKRILSHIMPLYEPDSEKVELLQQIEDFKAKCSCSDKIAATVFGTSDRTIRRLRKDYGRCIKPTSVATGVLLPMTTAHALPPIPFSRAEEPNDDEFFVDLEPL